MSTRRPRCTARWQRRRNLRYVRSIREVGRGSGFNPWVSGAARRPHESVALCRHRDRGARLGVLGRDSLLSARLTTRIGRGRSAAAGRSPHHRFKAQSQGDFPTYMRRVARLPGRLRAVARASASYNQLLRISAPPATSSHLLRRWPLPPAQVVGDLLRRWLLPPAQVLRAPFQEAQAVQVAHPPPLWPWGCPLACKIGRLPTRSRRGPDVSARWPGEAGTATKNDTGLRRRGKLRPVTPN